MNIPPRIRNECHWDGLIGACVCRPYACVYPPEWWALFSRRQTDKTVAGYTPFNSNSMRGPVIVETHKKHIRMSSAEPSSGWFRLNQVRRGLDQARALLSSVLIDTKNPFENIFLSNFLMMFLASSVHVTKPTKVLLAQGINAVKLKNPNLRDSRELKLGAKLKYFYVLYNA